MQNYEQLLTNHIREKLQDLLASLKTKRPKLVLGLSGGPDSVCLAHILKKLSGSMGFDLVAAHMDHGWRADSDKDVTLCKTLCQELGIELALGHAEDFKDKIKKSRSKEELARCARRAFFEQVLNSHDAQAVVLAHHAQDQIETFLIRLVRGSSLSGLAAMKTFNPPYFRPMLECPKSWIDGFISEVKANYITDPTNQSEDFLRNRIRMGVIPELEKADSRFMAKALETIQNLQAEDSVLEDLATGFVGSDEQPKIVTSDFLSLPKALQARVLVKLFVLAGANFRPSQGLFDEAIKFLSGPNGGTHQLGDNFVVTKKGPHFWVDGV